MFTDHGRPIPGRRVDYAVHAAAKHAGIGHVTPHQLRHTLATQAINRGMSLEAIAALLGHASLSMTMTYARIADRTVAEEYFAVTTHVDRLYNPAAPTTTTAPEGPNMQRLREESTRLLGNGTCTRPALLDCRYEPSARPAHTSPPTTATDTHSPTKPPTPHNAAKPAEKRSTWS
jgi:integrase-like protein